MSPRSYVVTGASTGIGRACVDALACTGAHVWASVRTDADEEALRRDHPDTVTVLRMDVTDADSVTAAGHRVLAAGPLAGLVNNAGVALPAPLEHIPIEVFRRQLEVNLIGQLAVTQAMLPAIRTARGRIVLISSIGGRVALPFTGAYHAAKWGLEAVGDSLRQELAPWGIRVSLIEPGSIDTPIWERGEASADQTLAGSPRMREIYGPSIERYRKVIRDTAARGIPPDKVAVKIQHALEARRPRTRYLVGIDARVQARLTPLLPTPLVDRIVAAFMGFPKPPDPQ